MLIEFTLITQNHALLKLVHEFAEAADCEVDVRVTPDSEVRARLPGEGGADLLLHLLSYVALSAVKLGVEVGEPRCRVRFREPQAPAAVTLALSVSAIDLGDIADTGPKTSR
jgi:hypothetical protein